MPKDLNNNGTSHNIENIAGNFANGQQRVLDISQELLQELQQENYTIKSVSTHIGFLAYSDRSDDELNGIIDKILQNTDNDYKILQSFLKDILKSFDAKRVSVITHIINKLFDTDPERIYYSTYIDMIKIYNNLSDDVQELEEIKNILNPYPDAWYNKEYFPLVKDSQNTQSMYKIIEDKATLVNKKLSELSNDLHFSPYSNFTTGDVSPHLLINLDTIESNISGRNTMNIDDQHKLLSGLDKCLLVQENGYNGGDRHYIASHIINGLYSQGILKNEYNNLNIPDFKTSTKDNGFFYPRLDVQDLMISFSLVIRYANKKNLKLSLSGDNAGLYSLIKK